MRSLAMILVVSALGCSRPQEATPPVPTAPPRPAPLDQLESAMRAREATEAFALVPFGRPYRATLEEGASGGFTEVLHPGFCYKLLVESEATVSDLDVLLYDGAGVLRQQDAQPAGDFAIGGERSICLDEPVVYRADVRMVRGRGPVLLQWYSNQ